MSQAELLDTLRAHAGDRSHRTVLSDALLSVGDPRGALMAAQLAGLPPPVEAWEHTLDAALAAVPNLDQLRVHAGMVVEISLSDWDHAAIDPSWIATQPLVVARVGLPSKAEELPSAIDCLDLALIGCRGVALSSRLDADSWPLVYAWLQDRDFEHLELDLSASVDELGELTEALSSVRSAKLDYRDVQVAETLCLSLLPELRRLCLEGPAAGFDPRMLAGLEHLEHLDLRRCALSPGQLEAAVAWRDAAPGRSLRHPELGDLGDLGLRPPDLDDVFGTQGLRWEKGDALRTRVAVWPADVWTFASLRGSELQLHVRDAPRARVQLDADLTELAALPDRLVLARREGGVRSYALDLEGVDSPRLEATLSAAGPRRRGTQTGRVRGLDQRGDALAVDGLAASWRWRCTDGADRDPADDGELGPVRRCLTLLEGGAAWVEGELHQAAASRLRVAFEGERAERSRTVELGEPILALGASATTVFALTPREVWRVGLDARPQRIGSRNGGRARIVSREGVTAWTSSRRSVTIQRGDRIDSLTYPDSYSGGCDEELAVADLAITEDGIVIAALEHGGLNLLTPDGALKADEFPGEPLRRWIFIYRGEILIAG